MAERLLQLDDLLNTRSPEKIAALFQKLGYNAAIQPLNIDDLHLPARSTEAIYDSYLIADQDNGGLQVLLFQLHPDEWSSSNAVSSRMRAIANVICQRATEFLLLATNKDCNQLMLVNPRKNYDTNLNLKTSIRKLLIDSVNPTNYDRDRLEAIAVRGLSPQELYKTHCEAFDVEKLTKSFYKGYKQIFDKVQQAVKEHNDYPYFADADRLHQFSQRLMGRIMFLYFLQKKGFLASDYRFLTNRYRALKTEPDETDYYGKVLEPLFFETLNKDRPNLEHDWGEGQIPYLNGGLFDRDYGEGIKDAAGRETPEIITLPNSLFDPGEPESILGFFNGYNFTIAENVAGDEDVAVDPEMLGKVFENMLAAEERGQSGTFYTPRGIVQFMCVEVLSRYLADATGMSLEAIRELIELDPDSPDSQLKQLLTKEQTKQLKQALHDVKVLDPAVGSGAFPLGMMQVILAVYQVIGRREGDAIKRGSLAMSKLKRKIIANNLYGVDIKPEAIEIAKLRMWLSLVVDIPDIEDVEPLPNLDYKLMCGDSLISTIHGERLIPDPTKEQQLMLAVTPIQMAIQPLLELQRRYFDAQTVERHELRSLILKAEANVFTVAVQDRRQFWLGKQQEVEYKVKSLKKVTKALEKEQADIATKLAELNKFAADVESGERSLNFFQYHLHFNDVFQEKGGFDVVIGNPPYVDSETMKKNQPGTRETYSLAFESAKGNWDLFVVFIEKGINLLKQQGLISYIIPNKFISARYTESIRNIVSKFQLLEIRNYASIEVFIEADVYPIVFILQKTEHQLISNKDAVVISVMDSVDKIKSINIVEPSVFYKNIYWDVFLLPEKTYSIFDKLSRLPKLSHFFTEVKGASTVNEAYLIKEVIQEYSDLRNYKDKFYKFINTGTIDRYVSLWSKQKTKYIKSNYTDPIVLDIDLYKINDKRRQQASSPKIIIAGMVKRLECIYDEGEYLAGKSTTIILGEPDQLKVCMALINSKLISFWYINYYKSLGMAGGYVNINNNEIKQIPYLKFTSLYEQKIINLVDKILIVKQNNSDTDISELDNELDRLIYLLYGLTEEEIGIIENST